MDNPLLTLADKLKWQTQSWSTLEYNVTRKTVSTRNDGHSIPYVIKYRYIETKENQILVNQIIEELDGAEFVHTTKFFNKTSGSSIGYKNKNDENTKVHVNIRSFKSMSRDNSDDRPIPFAYLSVNQIPLEEMLPKGVLAGETKVLGRPAQIVQFPNIKFSRWVGVMEYSLDTETGVPLRVTFSAENKPNIWTWEANSLSTIQGFSIPDTSFLSSTSSSGTLKFEFQVSNLVFNKSFANNIFEAPRPTDAWIYDSTLGKTIQSPPKKSIDNNLNLSQSTIQMPTVPETTWSAWVPGLVLGLFICLIFAVWTLRRRS